MKICKKRKAVIVMLFCSSMLCGQNYVPIHVEAQRWVKEKSNMYLEKINGPEDVKKLSMEQLNVLAGECEKLGDYVVNVVEAHSDVKEKKT